MKKVKLIKIKDSQYIKLPKEFNLQDDEIYINKINDTLVMLPKEDPYQLMFMGLNLFTDDFMVDGREQ